MSEDLNALSYLVAERVGFPLPPGATDVRWEAVTDRFVPLARQHGVVTLAYHAPSSGHLPPPVLEKLTEVVRKDEFQGMQRVMVQRRVVTEIERAGIPVLVMKGIGFSVLAYGDWAARGHSVDLDLLVPPEHVADVELLLTKLEYEPSAKTPPPSTSALRTYQLWLHYEQVLCSERTGLIDLHWRPMPGNAAWNQAAHCLTTAATVETPLGTIRTLGPVESLIVACSQGESEQWRRLKRLADAWAITRICSATDVAQARKQSRLVKPSLERLSARWQDITDAPLTRSSRSALYLGLWRMRRGSGTTFDAAVRSVFGAALPARRLDRLQSPSSGD